MSNRDRDISYDLVLGDKAPRGSGWVLIVKAVWGCVTIGVSRSGMHINMLYALERVPPPAVFDYEEAIDWLAE